MLSKKQALQRLQNIQWATMESEEHVQLFKEYMQRAIAWRNALSINPTILIYDATKYIDPMLELDQQSESSLSTIAEGLRGYTPAVCYSYVKLCAYMENNLSNLELPDLYEPLISIFESGGQLISHHGSIEICGCAFYLKDWNYVS